jgi:hypothetical protein
MANPLLPAYERNLTPHQVEALDQRRHRGLVLLVIANQFAIISVVLLLWLGQDLVVSPGWARPITYYFCFAVLVTAIAGLAGMYLRRGAEEFSN